MNKTNNSICEFLKYAIISLVFLVPFSDLIIGEALYFPYITGKGFVARAIVIVIALLYTSLIIRDKNYLPKRTTIVWSATIFILILLVATINSVNPWRSFWSNQERMEGLMTLAEMFVLFIVSTGVFSNVFSQKSKDKSLVSASPTEFGIWRWFLNTMLALSVIMGIYAFSKIQNPEIQSTGGRIFGTLGNSSYLGGYAMAHFFLALYLGIDVFKKIFSLTVQASHKIKQDNRFANIILLILYALVALFNLAVMYQTGTRGSFVGLIIGLSVMAIIWSLFERKLPLFKWIGIVSIVIVLAAIISLGVSKNTSFVKNNVLVNRFAQLITLDYKKVLGDQGHSRSMIWGMAYQGVKEKPILGWGQDNFPYVFAKYYDPAMYAQEQWFDRTHNVFFDWLIAAGLLGLLSYLALFFSAIYTLWKKMDDDWSITERAVLIGMLIAYFVHNIFVFDNLASYIFFFTILALINTRGQGSRNLEHKPLISSDYAWVIDIIAVVVCAYVMWIAVLSPYNSSGDLIKAMQDRQQVLVNDGTSTKTKTEIVPIDPKIRFNYIKSAIERNNLTRSESRERLVDVSASVIKETQKSDPAFAKSVYNYTIDQYKKEIDNSKTDPRPNFFLSIFYQKLGMIDGALEQAKRSAELSPTKQSFLFTEGQLLLSANKKDESVAIFKKAYELDKTDMDALKYYIYVLIENNKLSEVNTVLDEHSKFDPTFKKDSMWLEPMNLQALIDIKAYDKAISIGKQRVKDNPTDIQAEVSLSAIYLKAGDRWSAIEELKKIKQMKPEYSAEVDKYVKDIQDGKDPTAQTAQPAETQ